MWTAARSTSAPLGQAAHTRTEAAQTTWALSVGTCLRKSSDRTRPSRRPPLRPKEQGAAGAALSWFNRVVPHRGPPNCRALLCRRGVTRAQAPRAPVNVKEPALDEFRFPMATELSEGAIGGQRRTPLRSQTATSGFGARDSAVENAGLGEAALRNCIRSVTGCHRTDTNRWRGTGSSTPPQDYLAILSPQPCGPLQPVLQFLARSRHRGQVPARHSRPAEGPSPSAR